MWRFLKSSVAVALAIVPMYLTELPRFADRVHLIAGTGVVVFGVNFWGFFRPDRRFEKVREYALTLFFNQKFSNLSAAKPSNLGKKDRHPFRVTIMQPCGWFQWRRMKIVYTYGMEPTDSDYHLEFPHGTGLCWDVYRKNCVGWFDPDEHNVDDFQLNSDMKSATEHLKGILSIPIRRGQSRRPVAVLNFDGLTEAAREDLKVAAAELHDHNASEWSDLALSVSFFI